MKIFLISIIISLTVMLSIDAVWLKTTAKRFYARYIGHLMAETPNLLAAGVFYLIYTSTLSVLVIIPAVQGSFSLEKVFFFGATFGLAAYATYDLTNQATLKSWPSVVTVVDLLWGALLTGTVSVVTFLLLGVFL